MAEPEEPRGLPVLQRVLVTTDFSPLAERALPWAYALAGRGGTVHLLHVIESLHHPSPLYAHYTPGRTPTPAQRRAQRADIREKLRGQIPAAAATAGVATEVEVVEAEDVASAICERAERLAVDALCIASHGRSGVARVLLGSVAAHVLEHSHVPVLVIRPERS